MAVDAGGLVAILVTLNLRQRSLTVTGEPLQKARNIMKNTKLERPWLFSHFNRNFDTNFLDKKSFKQTKRLIY
jgi:hypothetical protein